MLWVKYVCLLPVKENFENVFKTCVIALELPMQCFNIHNMEAKHEEFNFKLRGISEFRKVSHESLLFTGTPSVRNLKF